MKIETIDTLASAGNRATASGAGLTVLGWVTSAQFVSLAGLALALAGVLVNWYYRAKSNRRNEVEHALRMDLLRSKQHITDLGELGVDE